MAEVSVAQVSSVTLCLQFGKISELNEVTSPVYLVQDASWHVCVKKKLVEGKYYLGYFLFRDTVIKDLIFTASASVKLLSWDENKPAPVEFHLANVFDDYGTGYGTDSLISWDELLSKESSYVRNDSIKLEVYLQVADPNDEKRSTMKWLKSEKCCEMDCVTVVLFEITNVKNLIAVRSPQFTIHKLGWNLTAYKSNLDHLGIGFSTVDCKDLKCEASLSVKIFSKIQPKVIQRGAAQGFNYFVVENAASINELVKPENGFIENGSVTIEVQIKAGCCSIDAQSEPDESKIKLECSICLEAIKNQDVSSTPCGHMFCTKCISGVIQLRPACPLCEYVLTLDTLRSIYLPIGQKF